MAAIHEEIVDALEALSGGPHPGTRAAHARGVLCAGSFTAAPGAAELSRAAHLSGEPVRVTARFSNGSGNPAAPDADRLDGRGLAVKMHLPDGGEVHSVTVSIPVFLVSTPEDFLALTRARVPDPETGEPDPAKVGEFLGSHPETAAALQLVLPALGPPRSYATCAYNSLHAFALVSAADERTWARLQWRPQAGEEKLSEEEIAAAADDYLQLEIGERIASGAVRFELVATLAREGDPLENPTVPWSERCEQVLLGSLELDEELPAETPGEPVVFDPMTLTDGIEPSGDRILAARPHAYSVSIERRIATA